MRMKNFRPLALAAITLFLLGGCITLVELRNFPEPPQIYGGTREHIRGWNPDSEYYWGIVVDIPFCFALDTALLPVTIPGEIIYALMEEDPDPEPSSIHIKIRNAVSDYPTATFHEIIDLVSHDVGLSRQQLLSKYTLAEQVYEKARASQQR